jgi:hypothetical protein
MGASSAAIDEERLSRQKNDKRFPCSPRRGSRGGGRKATSGVGTFVATPPSGMVRSY